MLSPAVINSLFPEDLPGPEHWEERYPPRDLPPAAQVTRFGPSPTGYLHIGGVYVAMIDADLARQSGGSLPAADRGHRPGPDHRRAPWISSPTG